MSNPNFFYDGFEFTTLSEPPNSSSYGTVKLINLDGNDPNVSLALPEVAVRADSFSYYVIEIGAYGFVDSQEQLNENTTTISLPNTITSISTSAFTDCNALEQITIASNNYYYTDEYGVLYSSSTINGNFDTVFFVPIDLYTAYPSYTIPASITNTNTDVTTVVTTIGDYAFANCRSLTSITIPNSVTSIGNYAFYNCRTLTSVTIPNSVTSIGENAFDDCILLTSVEIGSGITSIEECTFYNCNSLTSVTINSSNINSIGENAFFACSSLTNLTLQTSDTTINNNAFSGGTPLETLTLNGIISSFDAESLAYMQNASSSNTLDSLTFGGAVDATTQVPSGIGATGGSYYDTNDIFIKSLTNNAVIQVPGSAPPSAAVYSTSIVDAIQNDYPGVTFTINYNAVTTPNGVDYVFVQ